jgi:hypothetical protein
LEIFKGVKGKTLPTLPLVERTSSFSWSSLWLSGCPHSSHFVWVASLGVRKKGMLTLIQFLRPRWKSLYAARKRQEEAAAALPELPDSLFGWMPVLWRISEEQVLASAGLDAFVVRSRL